MFWGHQPSKDGTINKSCLSQWWECSFQDRTGICYNSAEQYMMARKAQMFCDDDTFKKILSLNNPKDIKSAGREVKGFEQALWDENNYSIVRSGNYLKFSQNPTFRDYLISTGNKIIVEASPYDTIWGIGMNANDKNALNPLMWKGQK